MRKFLYPALLMLALITGDKATAGSCGYDYCWGAVAVGPNGAYGFSHSWGSEAEAIDSAQSGCEWDCTILKTFYNSCAAIATAQNGGWGWGYDASRAAAEGRALDYCYDQGGGCAVRVWACSQ